MGGLGSGRHPGTARHVEGFPALDALELRRLGVLEAGAVGVLRWHRGGDPIGMAARLAALYELEAELYLEAQVAGWRRGGEPLRQVLQVDWSPCPFGGRRPWFRCVGCDRRALRLYLAGEPWFRCRRCSRLSYASQSETAVLRALRRAEKLRARLGVGPGEPVERPAGMRWRTFDRLTEALADAEGVVEAVLAGALLDDARTVGNGA